MKILLSLPPNLVGSFHKITGLSRDEFFCASDPIGHRVGSGGGSIAVYVDLAGIHLLYGIGQILRG